MSFRENTRPESESSSDAPVPCEGKNCFFWGRPSTQNLCSQCYKVQLSSAREEPEIQEKIEEIQQETVEMKIIPKEEEVVPASKAETEDEIIDTSPPPTPAMKPEEPLKRVQKDKRRCLECNKFLGFTGIKCKCGFTFCGGHRYPEQHDCEFDYEGFARDKYLQNRHQAAVADKIDGERL